MDFETLLLPVDKNHIIRNLPEGWEYLVKESNNLSKGYYLYDNEVDADTYNFEGYTGSVNDVDGGVVVTIISEDLRPIHTYDVKGRMIRDEDVTTLFVYESLYRCKLDAIAERLHYKKKTAVFLDKLQKVDLPLDDHHHLTQTMTGLWRYTSDLSGRIYVFFRSEIDIHRKSVTIEPFNRNMRVYILNKPTVIPMKDVVIYLITHENEMSFSDTVSFQINKSMLIDRRGWGIYVHLMDRNFNIHAFRLNDEDEVPENLLHSFKASQINGSEKVTVVLHGDAYEEELVTSNGEYKPQSVFYPASQIARPKMDSIFYDQDGLIYKFLNRSTRNVDYHGLRKTV